jgi:hypothetical protein
VAEYLKVFEDLRLSCATTEGNEAGRYVLEEARINHGGREYGITLYVQKIYIFEDIDKYGITGWIEMIDVDNIVSAYIKGIGDIPASTLVGQELLQLKFKTIGSEFSVDFTDHPLHIHKIENLRTYDPGTGATGATTLQYRIHFCAPELMNNDRIRVSQAYEDTYSEIVKDILKNHLKTRKDVWVEDTKDIHKVVIPNMHPFDAIRWITRQCRSKKTSNIPNYNFYETTKGYRFKTMHAQAVRTTERGSKDAKDYQMSYTVSTGRQDSNYLRNMMTARDYKFLRTGDTYEAIQKGMFASKSIQHDSYHKKFSIKATNYDRKYAPDIEALPARGFIKERHLPVGGGTVYVPDGTKYDSQHPLIEGNSETFTEFPDSRIFFTSTGTKHAYDFADAGGVRTTDNETDQLTTPLWHMQQSHDRYLQMQLDVWGVSGLQVGDGISIQFPAIGQQTPGLTMDYRWSLSCYITKLVHRIDLSADTMEYHCDIVCSAKDSSLSALPAHGNLAGADGKTGEMKDFSGSEER